MSSRLSSFLAILVAVVGLTLSSPALAGGIAYVDFARAADESTEVKAEQERLQKLYAAKLAELQKQSDDLKKAFEDYENRKLIMTEDARAQADQAIRRAQIDMLTGGAPAAATHNEHPPAQTGEDQTP